MYSPIRETISHYSFTRALRNVSIALVMLIFAGRSATAQTFSSGSTGADGVFAPTDNQTVQVPPGGVFNFTTVTIPAGVTIKFKRNAKNTPVTILATGDVKIDGSITIDGLPGAFNGGGGPGGPGGFDGGNGGYQFDGFIGRAGDGPGGGGGGNGKADNSNVGAGGGGGYAASGGDGNSNNNGIGGQGGLRYGGRTLLPLIGGSGGGGGGATTSLPGGPGGGGGGAILIASSTQITGSGGIFARGGPGLNFGGSCSSVGGGGGSGGAIRLITNTISGTILTGVDGGGNTNCNGFTSGAGSVGFVRVEAFDFSAFRGSGFISFALPQSVTLANTPQLKITSVAGVAAPASPSGSFHLAPDIVVPAAQANPVTVAIQGLNMPIGIPVQVILIPESGTRTSTDSTPLSGTTASSTATASVSLPTGVTIVSASVSIDLSSAAASGASAMFIDGERVTRVEVAATYGGASKITYVTRSGRRVSEP